MDQDLAVNLYVPARDNFRMIVCHCDLFGAAGHFTHGSGIGERLFIVGVIGRRLVPARTGAESLDAELVHHVLVIFDGLRVGASHLGTEDGGETRAESETAESHVISKSHLVWRCNYWRARHQELRIRDATGRLIELALRDAPAYSGSVAGNSAWSQSGGSGPARIKPFGIPSDRGFQCLNPIYP